MRRDLVLARVGRNSLHRSWIDADKPRDWDLYLCPFQEIAPQSGLDCTQGEVRPGPKWAGLRSLMKDWDGWRAYDYIWLPDDDIFASQDVISAMFEAGRALDFALFAPALHEASHYAHFVGMRNTAFFARYVGFVEIMVPCIRRQVLERMLSTLDLSSTGWGWGLDSLWPKLLEYRNLGIIDATPVLHTRAVGQFRDPDLSRRVLAESDEIMSRYACGQRMVTFAGVGSDLARQELDGDALLAKLVDGWMYLIRREPRVLRWIMAHQDPFFTWPEYPVSGQPTSPFDPGSIGPATK